MIDTKLCLFRIQRGMIDNKLCLFRIQRGMIDNKLCLFRIQRGVIDDNDIKVLVIVLVDAITREVV